MSEQHRREFSKKRLRSIKGRRAPARLFETLEDRRMLANFAVTTTADRILDTAVVTLAHRAGADGKLSLREAIYLANINPGPDTVTLKANSTYKITVAGGDEDADATGDFDVLDNLTINGKGNNSVVNGNGLDRVFNIPTDYDNVSLTFNYVVVTGGIARSSIAGGGRGGGVFSNSEGNTLTLNHSSIVNNISTSPNGGTGGGVWWFSGDINVIDSHVDRNSAAAGTHGFGGGMHLDQNGTITIKRSTVNGNTALEYGGGITSNANNALLISDSQLNNNHSGDNGGGAVAGTWRLVSITNSTLNGNTTSGVGGAVNLFSSAQLTIAKSKLTGNSALGDGGAVFASEPLSVIVAGSTFKDNNSTSGAGGAIAGINSIQVTDCVFDHNVAVGTGGAINQEDPGDITILRSTFTKNASTGGTGGAVNATGNAIIRITKSKFTFNSALEQGGALAGNGDLTYIVSSTFDHNSSTNGDGGAIDAAKVVATDSSFTYNTSKADGGAIDAEDQDLVLTRCVFSCNTATNGEGGALTDGGPDSSMTLIDCTIDGNSAGGNGGGFAAEGITLTMTGCTVSNNRSGSDGGGAYIITSGADANPYPTGLPVRPGSLIANCTFSGNGSATDGGGIDFEGDGDLTIVNCTIAFNTSFNGGGIAQTNGAGTIHIGNTIVAKNIATNDPDAYNPASGTFDDLGHNLVFADPDSVFTNGTDIIGLPPLLGALANNGGLTKTHALLKGSPAINAGDDSLAPVTDQRGVLRPQGSHADIGAYEKK